MGDFYGTGIEIWAGFGPVGSTEKKMVWADYEQLSGLVLSTFCGQKKKKNQKDCSVCTEKLHRKKGNFFFFFREEFFISEKPVFFRAKNPTVST